MKLKLKKISPLIIFIILSLTTPSIKTINQPTSFDEMKNAIISKSKNFTTLLQKFDITSKDSSGNNIFDIVIDQAKILLKNNQSTDYLINNFLNPLLLRLKKQANDETYFPKRANIYSTVVDLNLDPLKNFQQDAFYKTLKSKSTKYPQKFVVSVLQSSSAAKSYKQSQLFNNIQYAIMMNNSKNFTTLLKKFDITSTNSLGNNIFDIVINQAKTLLENNESTNNLIKDFLNPLLLRLEKQANDETDLPKKAVIYSTVVHLNLDPLKNFQQDAFYKTLKNKSTEYPQKLINVAIQLTQPLNSKLLMQNFAKALHAIQ